MRIRGTIFCFAVPVFASAFRFVRSTKRKASSFSALLKTNPQFHFLRSKKWFTGTAKQKMQRLAEDEHKMEREAKTEIPRSDFSKQKI